LIPAEVPPSTFQQEKLENYYVLNYILAPVLYTMCAILLNTITKTTSKIFFTPFDRTLKLRKELIHNHSQTMGESGSGPRPN
jgi:hypothetical protein